MAFDIYFTPDSSIINTNNNFATDLSGWTDATGSWTWDAEPGVVYDGDNELNPLSQTVTLAVGWHHLSITGGGISAGEYVVRLIKVSDESEWGAAVSNAGAFEGDANFEITDAGDYDIRLYATSDADGIVENVRLTTTDNRTPILYDDGYSLSYVEKLANPVFYPDNTSWTDATSSWTNSAYLAVYDNDGEANPLQTSVTIATAGWYRLGIEAAAGSTIGQLTARVQGVNASYIYWHNGDRESFFYLAASSYTVEFWTSTITGGGVKLVSLMPVDVVRGKKRKHRHMGETGYATPADELITAGLASGDMYAYLPPLALADETEITVKKSEASNLVFVAGDGSDTVDGEAYYTLTNLNDSVTVVATPDGWLITAVT